MKNENIQLVSSLKNKEAMQKKPTSVYSFNEFTLDLVKKKLLKNGQVIRIEKRMFKLLSLLVKNSPEALKKDDLMEQLWENQVVTDWSLSRLISDTRKVLGDDGKSQKLIRTVRGEGFSFVATVQQIDASGETIQTNLLASKLKSKNSIPKATLLSLFLFILALFGFNQYQNTQQSKKIDLIKSLEQNLILTKTSHQAQKKRRNELGKMIEERFSIPERIDWEHFFSEYHPQLNSNELFVFQQIRAITEGPVFEGNKNVLNILVSNPELKNDFPSYQALINHLSFWLNKYEKVFTQRKDMCLLYTGEEDGVPFPSSIDQEVADWLVVNSSNKH